MSKKLLYITHHQLDQNNGGANASKGFLHCMAKFFTEGTVMCHSMEDAKPYIPDNMVFMPLRDQRSKVRKMVDMYRGVINAYYYFVREHLRNHHYDVVVIDHTFSGAGLPAFIKSTGAKLITIHHNVERDYLRDNNKEKPLLYRWPFLHFSKKAERDCLRYSDLNLTVTEHDAKVFRSWFPESRILHWGIFEHRAIKEPLFEEKTPGRVFVISGSLYFRQSTLPVMDFVKRYWPLVLQVCPEASLIITGRNPSEELKAVCGKAKKVSIVPNPENMADVVRQGNYYICPIYAGSGLKLRIFDGLKQGLPVICHEVAANGYERVAEKECLFVYHDEQTFKEALGRLLSAEVSPHEVFQAFKASFSMQAGVTRLSEILHQEHIL